MRESYETKEIYKIEQLVVAVSYAALALGIINIAILLFLALTLLKGQHG